MLATVLPFLGVMMHILRSFPIRRGARRGVFLRIQRSYSASSSLEQLVLLPMG